MMNDFAIFPLPPGRLSTTMLMQSSGQICSQRRHPMHSSSAVSGSRLSRGTPRKRGARSGFSLGYSIVMCGRKWFLMVIHIPAKSSTRKNLLNRAARPFKPLPPLRPGSSARSLLQDEDESCHDDVGERDRQEPLPAEVHELIVPVPGKGPPNPDVQIQNREDLEGEPENPRQRGADEVEKVQA